MHVHTPKALHGWREIAREIAIIVVGIVIALLGEQAVEALHWHAEVADARLSLRHELEIIYFNSAERIVQEPCFDAQLDKIETALLRAGPTLTPLPIIRDDKVGMDFVYRVPRRAWGVSVWNSVNVSGLSSHFSAAERQELGSLYAETEELHETNKSETAAAQSLMVMAKPIELDPGVRLHLLELVESERANGADMRLLGSQVMRNIEKFTGPDVRKTLGTDMSDSGGVVWCKAHGFPIKWPLP